jgi:hypothetical protein
MNQLGLRSCFITKYVKTPRNMTDTRTKIVIVIALFVFDVESTIVVNKDIDVESSVPPDCPAVNFVMASVTKEERDWVKADKDVIALKVAEEDALACVTSEGSVRGGRRGRCT